MLCAEARRDVFAFLDGEIALDRRKELETHFSACGACREVVTSLDGVEKAMQSGHRQVTAPPALRERVKVALEREARWGGVRPWRRTGAAAVAAVVLAAAGFLLLPWNSKSEAASPQMEEIVSLHQGFSDGSVKLPCTETDLEAIRKFLGCSCHFQFCTHDLSGVGLSIKGASTAQMQTASGSTIAFTPYVMADGKMVTHFSVAKSCMKLRIEDELRSGEVVYYMMYHKGCQIVLFPHGDQLCIFVFAANQTFETVLVTAMGG